MARLRIYTVHINPSLDHAYESARFVQEGFLWKAFVFTGLWTLYHRLWWYALGIFVFDIAMLLMVADKRFTFVGFFIIQLGVRLIVGFHGTDWLRTRLQREGYLTADLTTGDSPLRAEQRYFDRYFAARPASSAA